MANLSDRVTPEMREKARQTRDLMKGLPEIEQLLSAEELSEASPLYFALRAFVAEIRILREERGLTLADISERTHLPVETFAQLEAGSLVNPTWQTLARYAVAVGCQIRIHADREPASVSNQDRG